MLKQRINGKTVATLYVEGSSADLDALKSIMEGAVEEFELKASGGTAAPLPSYLDSRRFVAKKVDQKMSATFRIHHLKEGKHQDDVMNAAIGNFDASFTQSVTCDDCYQIYKGGE